MPEIAEVARIVYHLKKSLVGKTLTAVRAQDDASVFGKVGTSGAEFQKSLQGKKVIDAGQQGKYFWLIMSSPPHPVLHFGMTGWVKIKGLPTAFYRPKEPEDPEWPPKYWKFVMETDDPEIQVAYTDPRRFGRIRLVDCFAEEIRNMTPLKENGPDPVIDKHVITEEWLDEKMKRKRVPVKALLLDQSIISGIGNYVGDEILYHAKIHPEQYSNTFNSDQLRQLHTSILHISQTAVDALGDSDLFPKDWIFHHRWGKGKKQAPTTLPTGEKTAFLTVGGRTSFIVPSVQKKTGAVAVDVKEEDLEAKEGEELRQVTNNKKSKKNTKLASEESPYFEKGEVKPSARGGPKRKTAIVKEEGKDGAGEEKKEQKVSLKPTKKRKVMSESPPMSDVDKEVRKVDGNRRVSRRLSGKGR